MTIAQGIDRMLRQLERVQAPEGLNTHRCRWRGRLFQCSISSERRGETVQIGGEVAEVSLSIIIRQSELGDFVSCDSGTITADNSILTADGGACVPVPNDNVQVESLKRTFRVATVQRDASQSHWTINCVDPDRP